MSSESIINLVDEELKIPEFKEPKTFQELLEQMAIISEAIGKCEKILQHLALAGYKAEMDEFITKHIQLICIKNQLYLKYKKFEKNIKSPKEPK